MRSGTELSQFLRVFAISSCDVPFVRAHRYAYNVII